MTCFFLTAAVFSGLSAEGVAQTQREEIQGTAVPETSYTSQTTAYTVSSVLRKHVDLVLVPVSVTDKRDRSVPGLAKEDFQLVENNRRQSIHSVSLEDEPSSIGIVLDLSDSMANKLDRAMLAIHSLLADANAGDEFLLITFSDQPRVAAGFASSRQDIETVLLTATAGGYTALVDAIDLAIAKMKEAKFSRRAIIVISDGGDNHSRDRLEDLKRGVQEQDLLIYSVGLYDDVFATPEEILGPRLLTDLSTKSGGAAFDARDRRDIFQAATSIANQVHSRYLLTYYPDKKPNDDKWHTIRVTLRVHGKRHLHVHAKSGYYGFQSVASATH